MLMPSLPDGLSATFVFCPSVYPWRARLLDPSVYCCGTTKLSSLSQLLLPPRVPIGAHRTTLLNVEMQC